MLKLKVMMESVSRANTMKGEIDEIEERNSKVNFSRKKEDAWKFYFLEKEDIKERNYTIIKLLQPILSGGRARSVFSMTSQIIFNLIKDKIM